MDNVGVQSIEQPIAPVPPVPKKSNGLVWVLVVLVVFLSAVTVFFLWQNMQLRQQLAVMVQPVVTPSPSPSDSDGIADWKTYKNDVLGIEFKYPPEYSLDYSSNSFKEGDTVSILVPAPIKNAGGKVGETNIILLTVAKPVLSSLSLVEWLKGSVYSSYPGKFVVNKRLAGQDTVDVFDCGEGCFTYLFTKHEEKVYGVVYRSDVYDEKGLLQKNIDQILSTFKFTE
ncbi:hypothetical protein A2188_03180 [Candidatus Woesebacteria bacterium RIFOXYA1_FULL_43_9]|uniref:PsbP C-terminal domain-containing protein n=1 Tax=Candidatus Woesebacteria bacterium RIFOXYA1_FULL_43_9 TaxID=1802534 RepID=A0A1F8CMP2_9BACT|nr:MAG: hypothetical protein A2188_03180 [Candidatus Woesebacteria bacterium RIFOXYA1_FULL_43_9]